MKIKRHEWLCLFLMCFVLMGVVMGVLIPSMQACDALRDEIRDQMAVLKAASRGGERSPRSQFRLSSPDEMLRLAREAGVNITRVEAPPRGEASAGTHLSGEASVAMFAEWLKRLSNASVGVRFSKVDILVEKNGQLHFSVVAAEAVHPEGSSSSFAWPLGNPFCHVASLTEAMTAAAVPPLQRYALSDIHWAGRAQVGAKTLAVLALPGGAMAGVAVGEHVGLEGASVTRIEAEQVILQSPSGAMVVLKQA